MGQKIANLGQKRYIWGTQKIWVKKLHRKNNYDVCGKESNSLYKMPTHKMLMKNQTKFQQKMLTSWKNKGKNYVAIYYYIVTSMTYIFSGIFKVIIIIRHA